MATIDDVIARRGALDQRALERWNTWSKDRREGLRKVDRVGILGAAGTMSAARRMAHTTVTEGRTFEALNGGDDTDQLNFLMRGWRAGRSVCRIAFGRTALGTGFLVAPGIVMTNNHVVSDPRDALGLFAEFDFERDINDTPMNPRRFALDPERLFVTSPQDRLDFSLIAVQSRSQDGVDLASYGWLPLDERTDKILEGEPVVIIQHPLGREKRICLFNSELEFRAPDDFLQYTTDTQIGSSGSPAFSRNWQVVGLHHASAPTGESHRGKPVVANEGVRVSSMVRALRTGAGAGAAILELPVGAREEVLGAVTDPRVLGDGRPNAPVVMARADTADLPEAGVLEARRTVIRRRQLADLAGRSGYDPAFLAEANDGNAALIVPLPALPDFLKQDAARLIGSQDTELKYHHYSVVMSKSRRLAVFSAANLDGTSLDPLDAALDRKDRDPDNPRRINEAAADVWYYDPRVAEEVQLPPDVYDETDFDFGHLTRRLDPVWGNDRDKRLANDDSFHMTNCAPQHKNLNQRTWLRLEDAAYKAAQKNRVRMLVMSGPVLDARDPEVLGVLTPTAYWKIVAFATDSRLVAQGFMQWQTELVDEIRRRFEGLPQLEPAQEWRASLQEIGRLTSLDFGPLLAADAFPGTGPLRERLTENTVDRLFPTG